MLKTNTNITLSELSEIKLTVQGQQFLQRNICWMELICIGGWFCMEFDHDIADKVS